MTPEGVEFFHEDTAQQRWILRTSKTARKVRAQFPPGTRVQPFESPEDGMVGVVQYHVPSTTGQGGTLVVLWPNGAKGRHSAISLRIVEVTQ